MKKLLVFILLLCGSGAFAQTGGLTIDNSHDPCDVWVKMIAKDPIIGDNLCSLNSYTFLVPAGAIWTFCSVYDFQGPGPACGMTGTGVYAPGWAFGIPLPLTGPGNFQWTDVTFQFECNPPTGCDAGGNMINGCTSTCFFGFGTTWVSPAAGCTHTATWVSGCTGIMGNLTLIFT